MQGRICLCFGRQGRGAKGLAWTKLGADGSASSSYEKFLSQTEVDAVRAATGVRRRD